jgi:acetolactate synthase-1/2/3 large subunit
MTQPKQIAGHLLVECLIEQGVSHVFGVPGESYLPVLDGFHKHSDAIKFVVNRHEGPASFMAEAVGKLTNRPGVCFVSRGPGATNASIGIHMGFQDSTPMVVFVGDIASDQRDREAFQELDYGNFFGPSTKGMAKRVERIDQAERIPEYVARAFATAMNGRPGPVVVVVPEDVLDQQVTARPLPRVERATAWADPNALRQLRDMLLAARKPFVIAGGSGWTPESAQALQRFAEAWTLPVGNAFRFQDTFDNHHPLYAGDVGIGINPKLAARIKESDLILALGPRLGDMTTGGYTLLSAPRPTQKLVHIHASGEELNRVYHADLAIHATMNGAALALEAMEAPKTVPWRAWADAASQDYLSNLVPQKLPGDVDLPSLVAVLHKHLPASAVLTNGAGNYASWTHRYFRHHGLAKGLKTQLAPTGGAMGYGVPAGMAAALTTGRTVVTLTGDGDFVMSMGELATAAQYGVQTIMLVLNNGMYGSIRMHQERHFPGRVSGSDLHNPDFAALAETFGLAGARVRCTADFEPALLAALNRDCSTVIEIALDPQAITTRSSLDEIRARAHAALAAPATVGH